jgi:hypothetical protein
MTTEELYEFIKGGDVDSIQTYLNSIDPITYPQLQKIDNLLVQAVIFDKIDIVKLLIAYNANPEQYNNWVLTIAQMYNCSTELLNYLRTGYDDNNETS